MRTKVIGILGIVFLVLLSGQLWSADCVDGNCYEFNANGWIWGDTEQYQVHNANPYMPNGGYSDWASTQDHYGAGESYGDFSGSLDQDIAQFNSWNVELCNQGNTTHMGSVYQQSRTYGSVDPCCPVLSVQANQYADGITDTNFGTGENGENFMNGHQAVNANAFVNISGSPQVGADMYQDIMTGYYHEIGNVSTGPYSWQGGNTHVTTTVGNPILP